MARLERAASTSQMWRPTNWATPGYLIVMIIPRSGRKSKFFLSVVIYVVKANFCPGFAAWKNPANARVARGSGLWLFPSWIDGAMLPKQARYQLRYTRLLSCLIRLGVFTQTRRDKSFATPGDLRAASGRTLPAYCTVFSSGAQGGNETFSTRDHPQARDVRSGRDGRILRIAPFCQVSCAENADRGDRPFPQGLAQAASSVSWRQTFTPAMAKAKTNQKMHMTRG